MLTDFKFWYIKRADNGTILEAGVRFYEGDVTTENETDYKGNTTTVTRYRRTSKLDPKVEDHLKTKPTKKDGANSDVTIYTRADFGHMKTDDELIAFLKGEVAKDSKRTPIDEQKNA